MQKLRYKVEALPSSEPGVIIRWVKGFDADPTIYSFTGDPDTDRVIDAAIRQAIRGIKG